MFPPLSCSSIAQGPSPGDPDKYNVLRGMYERRLRSVAATVTKALSNSAALEATSSSFSAAASAAGGGGVGGGGGGGGGASGAPAQQLPLRVAHIIDSALSNEREEELLRLQEELASRDSEASKMQR